MPMSYVRPHGMDVPGVTWMITSMPSWCCMLQERLRNLHRTLVAVKHHSSAAVEEAEADAQKGAAKESCMDTFALRRVVNQSLDTQMDFYTDCMAQWCLKKCGCKCLTCNCICKEAHAALAGRVYGK
eukprot:355679-Chlamydomonas_euryale.AAC.2